MPSERTWSVSDIVSAAFLNSNLRDAINFLANPPLMQCHQTTVQSIPNNNPTPILMDVNEYDTYNGHSTTVNNSEYVAQVAGYYEIGGSVAFASNATGIRQVGIGVNAATVFPPSCQQLPAAAGTMVVGTRPGPLTFLNVGDFVEIVCLQTSGGALSTVTTESGMSVRWVHA